MTVLAQVWNGASTSEHQGFERRAFERPALAPGETLVRVTTTTVCGSDRHTVSGRRPGACPSVLGHEGVGLVEESAAGLEPGTRVVWAVTSVCRECEHCRRGLTAKCRTVAKVGHESADGDWPLSGTYATHIHLPTGVAVVPVPDHVPDAVASTAGCAVATVMAVLEAAGQLDERTVLVTGIGMLGLVAVAGARARGAARVVVVDPSPQRVALALAAGADAEHHPGTAEVDVALELSGATSGVEGCLRDLAIGGVAVLAGSVTPGPEVSVDPEWVVRGWRTLTGVHNYEPRHLRQAVDFLAAEGASLPWNDVLAGPIPLDDLAAEFADPSPGLRTVVLP